MGSLFGEPIIRQLRADRRILVWGHFWRLVWVFWQPVTGAKQLTSNHSARSGNTTREKISSSLAFRVSFGLMTFQAAATIFVSSVPCAPLSSRTCISQTARCVRFANLMKVLPVLWKQNGQSELIACLAGSDSTVFYSPFKGQQSIKIIPDYIRIQYFIGKKNVASGNRTPSKHHLPGVGVKIRS